MRLESKMAFNPDTANIIERSAHWLPAKQKILETGKKIPASEK